MLNSRKYLQNMAMAHTGVGLCLLEIIENKREENKLKGWVSGLTRTTTNLVEN